MRDLTEELSQAHRNNLNGQSSRMKNYFTNDTPREINAFLKKSFFKNRLYGVELCALNEGIKGLLKSDIIIPRKQHLLVCLLLSGSKSDLDLDYIINFALDTLKLSSQSIAKAAIYAGNYELAYKIKHQLSSISWYSILKTPAVLENLSQTSDVEMLEKHFNFPLTENEQVKGFLTPADYSKIYQQACAGGHLELTQHLEALLGQDAIAAIKANSYYAYRQACAGGHLELAQHLEALLGQDAIAAAIKAYNYLVYRRACTGGDLELAQHLERQLGEDAIAAIKADSYYAYRQACAGGHLELAEHLEAQLGKDAIAAIKTNSYRAYRWACAGGHLELVQHLLESSACLAYAERHDREYGKLYIYNYLKLKLSDLDSRKLHFEQENPNGVFDLPPQNAEYAFYMLRNFVRRGVERSYGDDARAAEDLSNEIRFLLSIPSVRALCHQAVTVDENSPGQENELLRLALRLGNDSAAGILMQIPEVYQLATQNNFYQDELGGGIDLRQIAEDNESSMVALSQAEQKLVNKAHSHYKKAMASMGGDQDVFEQLKSELKRRFEANPAQLFLESNTGKIEAIDLPFEWSELQVLRDQLLPEQYQEALKAYYQHEAHTAYRYLSKPNYWMDAHASYVYVFEESGKRTAYRYSTFEEYIPLINLLFVAVFDKDTPGIDGYSVEGRKDLFIKQLALIGRAHNWDDCRPVLNDGEAQYNKDKQVITEEYDDLSGDKPSCYSGVKRRLFQSVLGHGLFKIVTKEIVLQALNERIRVHFEQVITLSNCVRIKQAYDGMIGLNGEMDQHQKILQSLDISSEGMALMIDEVYEQLNKTYPQQIEDKKEGFIGHMKNCFNSASIIGSHFIGFQSRCGLDLLLNDRIEKKNKALSHGKATENPNTFHPSKRNIQTPVSEKADNLNPSYP